MLKNYYLLKGIVDNDLEDHTKKTVTHHNLLVKSDNKLYQVNIDIQSDAYPNVKVYFNDTFTHPLVENIEKLTKEGLFNLNELSQDYKLDYVRSNVVPIGELLSLKPKPEQAISALLDQYVKPGCYIYVMGEFYSDDQEYEEDNLPHGLKLRSMYKYLPCRGIHDVHVNQGTPLSMKQHAANGIYQDGALFVKSSDGPAKAFFFMFEEQSLQTDQQGNPL